MTKANQNQFHYSMFAASAYNSPVKKYQRSNNRMNGIEKFNYGQKGWPRRYFTCPFVFKRDISEYYCLICGCIIYRYSSVVDHIKGKRHVFSLEQYGCDISFLGDDYYYCGRCNCVVPYCTNIYNHVTGKRHQNFLREKSWCVDWKSYESFICPFVLFENFDNYYCLVCGCYMSGTSAYESHVRGKLHASVVEMFGRHIFPLGDDYYYCNQCDCAVPHYKNVYGHIIGRRHENLSEQMNEHRTWSRGINPRKKEKEQVEMKERRDRTINGEEETKLLKFDCATKLEILECSKLSDLSDTDNRQITNKTEKTRKFIVFSEDFCNDFADPSPQEDVSEETNEVNSGVFENEETDVPRVENLASAESVKSTKLPFFSDEFFELLIGKHNLLQEVDGEYYSQVWKKSAQTPKSAPFTEDLYNWFIGHEDASCEINEKEEATAKNKDSRQRKILDEELQQFDDNSNQIVIKNTTNINRKKNFVEAKKRTKFEDFFSQNYTILPRPVCNETKNSGKGFICEKITKSIAPRVRLNLSSWQLSSCNNALQNSTVKNKSKNSVQNNLKSIVNFPMQRAVDISVMLLDSELIDVEVESKNSIVFSDKFVKQSKYLKNTEDLSTERNSPDVSITDLESFSNSTSRSSEIFDINCNERSNVAPMSFRPEYRDTANLSLKTTINDFTKADPIIHDFDLNMNDLSSNIATSTSSNEHIDEDSLPPRSPASINQEIRTKLSWKLLAAQKVVESTYADDTRLSYVIDPKNTFCLVCRKVLSTIEKNYIEHLRNIDHRVTLEEKTKDHAIFQILPGEFSELHLAREYMVEMTEDIVYCIICDDFMLNVNYALQTHIEDDAHKCKREVMRAKTKLRFALAELRIQRD